YLRCAPGQALALAHEAPLIAAAVNRYFGYLLVKDVRMSLEPMTATADTSVAETPAPSPEVVAAAGSVSDQGVREALIRLGNSLRQRRK
ncbi:MAG TPA: hypothetical protein VG757_02835, partial [Devosia sp.]|nr:hypothetical protein [Devosia sp.]